MSKKKKPISKINEIYLTYDEDRSGGMPLNNEPWSERKEENIDFCPRELFANKDNLNWIETIKVNFNPVDFVDKDIFVVIVRYSTGDTFGNTNGAWQVIGAYNFVEEAEKIIKSINDDKYNNYAAWKGYFERLTDIEVHKMTLKKSCNFNLENVKYFDHK